MRRTPSNKEPFSLPRELEELTKPLGHLSWALRAQAAAAFRESPEGVAACVQEALRGTRPRSFFGVLLRQGMHGVLEPAPTPQTPLHPRPIDECMNLDCRKRRPLREQPDGTLLCDECS